ncbi:hypothetical protein CY34DRAFT_88786 [Suillus luteus UH-Slu-Lm8-n1]|uniref:Uncharacterized protein n=1 Tax=Suillus luteus UH-Slu-Lm8-n1 TaxID=930992 RepID=A0A0C9ZPR2_9AGAM|nr:hypothetical protein CY34DRAFT_88786 [Suillus luteus UH-Slu-Lm8-n1]
MYHVGAQKTDICPVDHQPTQEGSQKSALETPPPKRPHMLNRAVDIMNKSTSDDQRILAHIAALHERAKMLREQAKDVRDVMRAEQGQRMRLEAYFAYRLLQGDFT